MAETHNLWFIESGKSLVSVCSKEREGEKSWIISSLKRFYKYIFSSSSELQKHIG